MEKNKTLKRILVSIITILLVSYLIWKFDPKKIFEALKRIEWLDIAIINSIMIVLFLVKTFRWSYILKKIGINTNFFKLFKLSFVGMFGAAITPAKIGDLFRAHKLSQETGKKETDTYFSVILDRLMDLINISFFSVIAVPFFFTGLNRSLKWGLILTLIGITLIIFIALDNTIAKKFVLIISKFKTKNRENREKTSEERNNNESKMQIVLDKYYNNLDYFKTKDYLILILLSFIFWILLGIQACVLLTSLEAGFSLNIQSIVIVNGILAIVAVIALIPITISGVGIREVGMILLLGYSFGVQPENAISISFLQTISNVLLPGIIGGILTILENYRIKALKTKLE